MTKETDFWDMLDEFEVCMVTTEKGGKLFSRPMAPYVVREDNVIRFLTGASSPKVAEILHDSDVNLAFADPASMDFASVCGKAEISHDRELIRELWNAFAEAWFGGDPETAEVAVVTVRPTEGQYWRGSGSRVVQLWELAKAKVTGNKPDMGESAKLDLSH